MDHLSPSYEQELSLQVRSRLADLRLILAETPAPLRQRLEQLITLAADLQLDLCYTHLLDHHPYPDPETAYESVDLTDLLGIKRPDA